MLLIFEKCVIFRLITTLLGTDFQLITPLNTGKDAQYIAQLPESNTQELFDKYRIAEELFKINAEEEKIGRSWQLHALNKIVNHGSGLITWLTFERSVWDGVSNFLLNSVVTETQIWTQPTRLMRDYHNYNHKYKSDSDFFSYKNATRVFSKNLCRRCFCKYCILMPFSLKFPLLIIVSSYQFSNYYFYFVK